MYLNHPQLKNRETFRESKPQHHVVNCNNAIKSHYCAFL